MVMEKHWIDNLRERFAGRTAPAPDGLWEGIEAAMRERKAAGGVPVKPSGQARLAHLRVRRVVSIAASVAVLVGVGWFFLGRDVRETVTVGNTALRTATADVTAAAPAGSAQVMATRPSLSSLLSSVGDKFVAVASAEVGDYSGVELEGDSSEVVADAGLDVLPDNKEEHSWNDESVVINHNKRNNGNAYGRGNALLAVADNRGGGIGDVDIAVYGAGGASFGSQNGGAGNSLLPFVVQQSQAFGKDMMLLTSADNGLYNTEEASEVRVKHRQPVKVGMSVRFKLAERFGLEGGVNYSYHSSEIASGDESGGYKTEQKLHFIGIPVNAYYDIWHTDFLDVYVSAGGAAEFCVSGKSHTDYMAGNSLVSSSDENVRDTRPQWSVNASAGVQYNFSNLVGIYAEPGISYYFDNGSNVSTIYKDKPVNFNLNVGLRFTIR